MRRINRDVTPPAYPENLCYSANQSVMRRKPYAMTIAGYRYPADIGGVKPKKAAAMLAGQ